MQFEELFWILIKIFFHIELNEAVKAIAIDTNISFCGDNYWLIPGGFVLDSEICLMKCLPASIGTKSFINWFRLAFIFLRNWKQVQCPHRSKFLYCHSTPETPSYQIR